MNIKVEDKNAGLTFDQLKPGDVFCRANGYPNVDIVFCLDVTKALLAVVNGNGQASIQSTNAAAYFDAYEKFFKLDATLTIRKI